MECISNELGEGHCGLCRLSFDRYCKKKWLVAVSNDKQIEQLIYRGD